MQPFVPRPAVIVLTLLTLVLTAGLAGVVLSQRDTTARPAAQDCGDWVSDTADRVAIARQLLYPPDRQEETTGSLDGDAQALGDLADEQAQTEPPEEAFNLNGDLVEAFAAGSEALLGGGAAAPEAQIAFAKAIVYNADLRLGILNEGC